MINRKPLFKGRFKGDFESASIEMDMIRGIAASAIVIHHWVLFMPHKSSFSLFYNAAEMIQTLAGTTVHLFFILSGFGLTISYFKKNVISWKDWSKRRFRKVIFPYWIIIIFIFLSGNIIHYIAPALFKRNYSSFVLLAYLTLTRNFFKMSWEMNFQSQFPFENYLSDIKHCAKQRLLKAAGRYAKHFCLNHKDTHLKYYQPACDRVLDLSSI